MFKVQNPTLSVVLTNQKHLLDCIIISLHEKFFKDFLVLKMVYFRKLTDSQSLMRMTIVFFI